MATYMTNAVNTSPTMTAKAGAAVGDIRGLAVKFDASGNLVPAGSGEECIGIALITAGDPNGKVEMGDNVDFQIFGSGLGKAGAAVKAGDNLASDGAGKLTKAAAGDFIIGTATRSASGGAMVPFLMWRAFSPAASI